MTGKVSYGSGCCNSFEVPVSYRMDGSTLVATVTGEPTVLGDPPAELPIGTELTFKVEENQPSPGGEAGEILVQDNPFGYSDPIVWCTETIYDTRCGA